MAALRTFWVTRTPDKTASAPFLGLMNKIKELRLPYVQFSKLGSFLKGAILLGGDSKKGPKKGTLI